MTKMASEITLFSELWKYKSKKSLPEIALHRYWKASLTHFLPSKLCTT
jgi:hypothetical protein